MLYHLEKVATSPKGDGESHRTVFDINLTLSPEFEKQESLRRKFVEEFGKEPSKQELRLLGLSIQCEPLAEDEQLGGKAAKSGID